MIKLSGEHTVDQTPMKETYVRTMVELFDTTKDVVALYADSMFMTNIVKQRDQYADRMIQCGIAEAHMMGMAAGLSAEGFTPFVNAFSVFLIRRAMDQLYMSCAYAHQNVKVIGYDPGIACAYNGGTHAANEDIAMARAIPDLTIIDATDNVMLEVALKLAAKTRGMFFIRCLRVSPVKIYEQGSTFEIGKAVKLKEGTDVTIFAEGMEVSEALTAAELLKAEGISAAVFDIFSIKPIDESTIIEQVKRTGAIVTAENHNVIGGLASAVSEVLAAHCPAPLEKIGISGVFGEVGPTDYLRKRFNLTAADIAAAAKKAIARKQGK